MPYLLDIRTLSLTSGIISLILCVCMLYVYRCRKTYDGFTHWTTASILYFLGMALLSTRGVLPDFITIVIANTLLVAGNALIAYGIEAFVGSRRRTWLFISLALATFLLLFYFTYSHPNVSARIAGFSAAMATLCAYCGLIVHRYVPRFMHDKNMLLVAVFGAQALWLAFRIVSTLVIEGAIVDFMNASVIQAVSFIVFLGGTIFVIVGLIIMNFQRVELDLVTAMEEVKTLRGIIPICSYCKKIRNDEGTWNQLELYIREHSEAEFSHSICPACKTKLFPELAQTVAQKPAQGSD